MARKRRGRGEGSIYQRDNGTWCATYGAGYNALGKRLRRTVFGATKVEVRTNLARAVAGRLDGTLVEPSKTRLAVYLERWLEDAARPAVRLSTYVSYQGIIENHLNPRTGGTTLAQLNPAHVQRLYADMERAGVGARTRQLTHAVLRRSLKQAVKWGLIARNPCDAVDPPRVPKHEITPLNPDQVQLFLEAVRGDRMEAVFTVAIGTGLRLGEIFGLHWKHIDLKGHAIGLVHTLLEVKGKLILTEAKTAKSRRRIDLPKVVVEALIDHRARMLVEGFAKGPWVFCNTKGGPLRRSHFQANHFKPLLRAAGLPDIRFHDLRHTSATLLLSAGVHPKIVQERLGHSQIGITMDTYSHVLPTMQHEAAGKLDALMRSGPPV